MNINTQKVYTYQDTLVKTTTGKIAKSAAADAACKLLVVCEKKDEIARVIVFILLDCKTYNENW